jgi:type II secretory pathway pseudopilin PulG
MTLFPPRRHRRPRADGGFVLLEAIVSIALITILMTALTALFVSTMKVTDHQRTNQSAVRLATDVIDNARGLGAANVTTTPTQQTIGNVTYTVTPTQEPCSLAADGSCADDPAGKYVRYGVLIEWSGPDCGASPCKYRTSVVLSAAPDPTFLAGGPTSTSSSPTTTTSTTETVPPSTSAGFGFSVPPHSVLLVNDCGSAVTLTDDLVQYVTGASAPENLTFQKIFSSLGDVMVTGQQLSIKQPCTGNVAAGTYTATVSVTDSGLGISAQSNFAITVATS